MKKLTLVLIITSAACEIPKPKNEAHLRIERQKASVLDQLNNISQSIPGIPDHCFSRYKIPLKLDNLVQGRKASFFADGTDFKVKKKSITPTLWNFSGTTSTQTKEKRFYTPFFGLSLIQENHKNICKKLLIQIKSKNIFINPKLNFQLKSKLESQTQTRFENRKNEINDYENKRDKTKTKSPDYSLQGSSFFQIQGTDLNPENIPYKFSLFEIPGAFESIESKVALKFKPCSFPVTISISRKLSSRALPQAISSKTCLFKLEKSINGANVILVGTLTIPFNLKKSELLFLDVKNTIIKN